MALLTLVRHGQASYLADDYDKLSLLGRRQAHVLAQYWLRIGAVFDRVYYGPARRHTETGEIVADLYREARVDWPEPVVLPAFDEYAGIEVMRKCLPNLVESDPAIQKLEAEFRAAANQNAAFRAYDRLFQRIMRMWASEQLHTPDLESWKCFRERVANCIETIRTTAPKNGRVVVFTSGGVIGATLGRALDLAPHNTLEVSWASRNASFTEFLFSGERFTLSTFNSHPHLQDAELLTYR